MDRGYLDKGARCVLNKLPYCISIAVQGALLENPTTTPHLQASGGCSQERQSPGHVLPATRVTGGTLCSWRCTYVLSMLIDQVVSGAHMQLTRLEVIHIGWSYLLLAHTTPADPTPLYLCGCTGNALQRAQSLH